MTMPPLPCPFCGSAKLNEEATGAAEIKGHTYQTGWIECRDCGCDGPSVELTDETPAQNDYQLVRDAWNRRAAIAAHVPEAVAAVPAQPVAWTNAAMLKSAEVSRHRGGPFDVHAWSEGPTDIHDVPLYAAPQAVPVPANMALVPLEPTPEMLEAARNAPIPAVLLDSFKAQNDMANSTRYRAMLAAAPKEQPHE